MNNRNNIYLVLVFLCSFFNDRLCSKSCHITFPKPVSLRIFTFDDKLFNDATKPVTDEDRSFLAEGFSDKERQDILSTFEEEYVGQRPIKIKIITKSLENTLFLIKRSYEHSRSCNVLSDGTLNRHLIDSRKTTSILDASPKRAFSAIGRLFECGCITRYERAELEDKVIEKVEEQFPDKTTTLTFVSIASGSLLAEFSLLTRLFFHGYSKIHIIIADLEYESILKRFSDHQIITYHEFPDEINTNNSIPLYQFMRWIAFLTSQDPANSNYSLSICDDADDLKKTRSLLADILVIEDLENEHLPRYPFDKTKEKATEMLFINTLIQDWFKNILKPGGVFGTINSLINNAKLNKDFIEREALASVANTSNFAYFGIKKEHVSEKLAEAATSAPSTIIPLFHVPQKPQMSILTSRHHEQGRP